MSQGREISVIQSFTTIPAPDIPAPWATGGSEPLGFIVYWSHRMRYMEWFGQVNAGADQIGFLDLAGTYGWGYAQAGPNGQLSSSNGCQVPVGARNAANDRTFVFLQIQANGGFRVRLDEIIPTGVEQINFNGQRVPVVPL